MGRIGVITNRERHPGSFDVVHVKDSTGNSFATRLSNIFIIGKVRIVETLSPLTQSSEMFELTITSMNTAQDWHWYYISIIPTVEIVDLNALDAEKIM